MTKQQKKQIEITALRFALDTKLTKDELSQRLHDVENDIALKCPLHDPCSIGYVWSEALCACIFDGGK